MMRKLVLAFICAASAGQAQSVVSGTGAVLRMLDKTSGTTRDIEMRTGEINRAGPLQIALLECRHPADNPAGNAYASLSIIETGKPDDLFSGWMIASAPALSAMEHPRYDVWVLRCMTS